METKSSETQPDFRAKRNWRALLGFAGCIILGALLLVAAWSKATGLLSFAEEIHADGLDFFLSAGTVALIALALEAGLGLALLLGIRRLWLLAPVSLLILFFLFLNGRNYWLVAHGLRKETSSCGCFGSLLARTPGQAFWQDILMLLPPLLLALWGRETAARRWPRIRLALAVVSALGVVGYAVKTSDLRLIEVATQSKPGAAEVFQRNGDYLVVLDGREAPEVEIYYSDQSLTFLIMTPQMPFLVLLRPATSAVETADKEKVTRRDNGRVELQSKAATRSWGQFQVTGDAISFSVDGHQVRLKNKTRPG
ncbi:MAG TPA: MauE/DoxX family redox-associated membrane protein [Acidobacteriota bacterium]|jgi:hypothetical protein